MEATFSELIKGSLEIRQKYHVLEKQMHKSKWTLEEDALAFITDAALVGRLIMSYEERWPIKNTIPDLRHKIAECMWWLIVLAKRTDLDPEELFLEFLEKTDKKLR